MFVVHLLPCCPRRTVSGADLRLCRLLGQWRNHTVKGPFMAQGLLMSREMILTPVRECPRTRSAGAVHSCRRHGATFTKLRSSKSSITVLWQERQWQAQEPTRHSTPDPPSTQIQPCCQVGRCYTFLTLSSSLPGTNLALKWETPPSCCQMQVQGEGCKVEHWMEARGGHRWQATKPAAPACSQGLPEFCSILSRLYFYQELAFCFIKKYFSTSLR